MARYDKEHKQATRQRILDTAGRSYAPLGLAAIALRVDAPAALEALHIQRAAGPAARALGAYPFDNSFTLGCHGPELGSHLDLTTTQPKSANAAGALDSPATDADGIITGWAVVNGTRPDCILITDPSRHGHRRRHHRAAAHHRTDHTSPSRSDNMAGNGRPDEQTAHDPRRPGRPPLPH